MRTAKGGVADALGILYSPNGATRKVRAGDDSFFPKMVRRKRFFNRKSYEHEWVQVVTDPSSASTERLY